MNDKNGKNGKNGTTKVEPAKDVNDNDNVENSTVIKALKAEWRKAGSKPMTEAQTKEVKEKLAHAKKLQAAAAKATQDAADAQSEAIALIVKYSGQTTVTLDGKRQIIGCRHKALFLRAMPVFDEGVTI